MSSAIDQMKKTLDANKTHVENALKEVADQPVKAPKKPTSRTEVKTPTKAVEVRKAKPTPSSAKKPPGSKTHRVGKPQAKSPAKRFSDAFEKAVATKPTLEEKSDKPDVTVRIEVNNHQVPSWESASTTVSVETPRVPETVIDRQMTSTTAPTIQSYSRRYEDTNTSRRSNGSSVKSKPVAVMGVLGSGFRAVSPVIKR